jgi:hypothetical protein
LNLETKWNLTDLTSTDEIDKAIEKLKATNISVPSVNLTNPTLNRFLEGLEYALNPNTLNFTHLIDLIKGPIIATDLRTIREGVRVLNISDLTIEVSCILNRPT